MSPSNSTRNRKRAPPSIAPSIAPSLPSLSHSISTSLSTSPTLSFLPVGIQDDTEGKSVHRRMSSGSFGEESSLNSSASLDRMTPALNKSLIGRPYGEQTPHLSTRSYFQKKWTLFASTFAMSMLEPWEVCLLLTVSLTITLIFIYSAFTYLPGNIGFVSRRAIYYWTGSERAAMEAGILQAQAVNI